ncbi:fimbria/pilus outer membrane usher protein [Jejubacter sp. L23]
MMAVAEYKKISSMLLGILFASGMTTQALAKAQFNPALLERQGSDRPRVDLSAFEEDAQQPGIYHVDVVVNRQDQETRDIAFMLKADTDGKKRLWPCLSEDDLIRYGVRVDGFPALNTAAKCVDLNAIPDADAQLIFSEQRLILSIPQAAMTNQARGYVPPEKWDEGISAFWLNYSFSGANYYAKKPGARDSDNQYLNVRPSLNIGPWRLRNYTTWSRSSHGDSHWDTIYTFLQRDIVALKSQLTLGESSSPSDIYDSVSFRGVQLASDDEMLPDSLKGYAPVVRGIARTNAQVIIRQNGYIIYQSYVAPGAFTISDMYPTGGSGDLYITIKEADGTEQHMVVPFASVPVLQREGRMKYSLTSGTYRSYQNNNSEHTFFTQGTGIWGLPYGFTIYGGTQLSSRYQSVVGGLGKNLGMLGALSLDMTQSWGKPKDEGRQQGQSWRVRYSKNFVDTGTNFAIAGYRYSTRGFYTLNEVMDSWYNSDEDYGLWQERRRNRAEMTLSQNLWQGAGALTFSLIGEDYWNNSRQMRSVSVGYNNSWEGISYSVNYSYNRNSYKQDIGFDEHSGRVYDKDQILAFSINIPLERWLSNTWASYSINTQRHGDTSQTVGLNGTALADNNLNWSVQESRTNHGEGSGGNLNADYQATYGEVNAGYAWDKNSRRVSYGIKGAAMLHEDGITLSQPLGETVALVKAPGVSSTRVINQTGVKTDFRGYTVVPYMSAYRRNEIALDPETLADNVELEQTTRSVVPTRGAVVRADFSGRVGQRVMVKLTRPNGLPVPFGATVTPEGEGSSYSSIVGDDGEVYLSGLQESGTLGVSWGNTADSQCRASYRITSDGSPGLQKVAAECR